MPTHLSLGEIGDELHVSRNTVKSQVAAVYRKLGCSTRTESSGGAGTSACWSCSPQHAPDSASTRCRRQGPPGGTRSGLPWPPFPLV